MSRLLKFLPFPGPGHPAALLLGAASGIAGWLAWHSLSSGAVLAGCGAGGGCSGVLHSRFAYLLGLPVSVFGLTLYLTALAAMLTRRPVAAALAAWTILAGALWFVGLQALILKAWCPWCCAAHALASAAAVLLILRSRRTEREISGGDGGGGGLPVCRGALTGLVLTSLLGLAQALAPRTESSRFVATTAVAAPPDKLLGINEKGEISLLDGKVTVEARQFPLLGRPGFMSPSQALENPLMALMSPQPVILLSDWTCPHCRQLLAELCSLKQTPAPSSGTVPAAPPSPAAAAPGLKTAEDAALAKAMENTTVVLLPAWRDEAGREVHRLMLSAWLSGGGAYETLRAALLDGSLAATPEAVEAKAKSLLGEKWERSQKTTAGPVEQILATGEKALRETDALLSEATLPRMISAGGLLSGAPSPSALRAFVEGGSGSLARQTEEMRQEAVPNKSRIEFETTAITTAPVAAGGTARAEFHFRNTGSEPLHLVSIRTSCACTLVEGWKQTVPPGGKGSFSVNVDTTGHTAPMSRQFGLITNAENAPTGGLIPLRVTADVIPPPGSPAVSAPPTAAGGPAYRRQFN